MKRFVAAGGAFAAAVGGILWFLLLMSTAADTVIFSRNYPLLIALNVVLALGMLGLVGWQLRTLWRDYQAQVFGARLKLRLMLMFGVIAVLPGALVYGVSVQFVTRSIESWFDVRVEKALESGLHLGRSALDSLLADVVEKGRSMAGELSDIQETSRRSALLRLREEKGVQTAALFSVGGQLLSSATSELSSLMPDLPDQSQLKAARSSRSIGTVEGDGGKLYLRVLVPVSARDMFEEPRILQLTQPVPTALADDADAVQGVYRDYQELQLARDGLTRIYALTLTLTVLVALFGAFALAYLMARRLVAPLYILAEGTQAVAQGDFSPRQAIYSGDELGVLTQSFNRMTRQLDDARRDTERHRAELESARGYLESILANLSTGVLVFDRRFVLRTVNEGALTILNDDFDGVVSVAVDEWPRQQALGTFIREQFAATEENEWQAQLELERPNGMPQVLLLRGSRLPETSGGGDVVVFEDPGNWMPPSPPVTNKFQIALEFIGVLPNSGTEHLIKRVIGMPGDHVRTTDDGSIEGRTFKITGADFMGNPYAQEFQTDENGEINVELRVGEYTVAEAAGEDAEKYILPDDQTVGIKAGETTTVKMHNKLVPEVPTVPQTGDNPWMPAILGTLAGLAVLSGGALLFLRYTGKKRKSADQADEDQGTEE